MAKKSGSTKLKRQLAPAFWQISRKEKRFALTVSPGPHPTTTSYPLGILLRDVLRVANTMREVRKTLHAGEVKVDGVVRRNASFPVGLMDVVEVQALGKSYRLVPKNGLIVTPVEIPGEEKSVKLCKVTKKATMRGNKLQYGLHDGRTLIDGEQKQKLAVNDTCLLTVPEQGVKDTVRLEKGALALVISGENAGAMGTIQEIKPGTFILPKRLILKLRERMVELPVHMVMAVGTEKPLINLGPVS